MDTSGMHRVATEPHRTACRVRVRSERRPTDMAALEGAQPDSIKRFLRTINLTAVQLQAAFPHVGLLLHALAAASPRIPAARRTVAIRYRHLR